MSHGLNADKLVHMANQIGQFFDAMPERQAAREGIAGHLQRYWAPSMRQALLDALDTGRAGGLSPLVREALAPCRAGGPASGPQPTRDPSA